MNEARRELASDVMAWANEASQLANRQIYSMPVTASQAPTILPRDYIVLAFAEGR
jgi:hypothetical protein